MNNTHGIYIENTSHSSYHEYAVSRYLLTCFSVANIREEAGLIFTDTNCL